jgi:hypothetical protein
LPAGADPGAPFSLPFTVENKSIWFAWFDASYTCVVDNAAGVERSTFEDIRTTMGRPEVLEASSLKNVMCGIDAPANFIVSASMHIEIHYRIRFFGLLFPVSTRSRTFRWIKTTDGGRWVGY